MAIGLLGAASAHAATPLLRAGVGRADITPPVGYYMMGWVRSDAKTTGQHTRLWARVIVLQQGARKVALVTEDLNGIPGGMLVDAAHLVADRGFNETNVLDSASHTHAAPSQYYNFGAYNTVFPTAGTPGQFNTAADPQLYSFMVRRLALAIRRADDNLGPASIGWGSRQLLGITQNRSIEAHLADRGIIEPYGTGSASQDPLGYAHTIDPNVDVMRVDKIAPQGRHVPVGMWSTFADHGTVNRYTFHFYNEDHHGAATHVVEDQVRRIGHVPRKQDVVNAYGNSDEGDISAGLYHDGPAYAEYVGRVEARQFMAAWRSAGQHMTRTPGLDLRWTRICFCGQNTDRGPVDSTARIGTPLLTGSEEGRGPLYDQTHQPLEGDHLPIGVGAQGDKIIVPAPADVPKAVPLTALRIADREMVSVPGEMTEDMGRRVRAAVLGVAGPAVHRIVIVGLANEYLQYFTTPEEYDQQHYEGGSTLYGRTSSELIKLSLVDLAKALAQGKPAPTPYPYDPRNGLVPDQGPFSTGAASAKATKQPTKTLRLQRATFSWQGGPRGEDRPLDRAFVTVQKRVHGRWRSGPSDLGLQILWDVDDNGVYTARWEIPLVDRTGKYRFRVTGNRYRLVSKPFVVAPSTALRVIPASGVSVPAGAVAVSLAYPTAVVEQDITYRPDKASAGRVTFLVGRVKRTVRVRKGGVFIVHAGKKHVSVPAGAGRDRFGNRNAKALAIR